MYLKRCLKSLQTHLGLAVQENTVLDSYLITALFLLSTFNSLLHAVCTVKDQLNAMSSDLSSKISRPPAGLTDLLHYQSTYKEHHERIITDCEQYLLDMLMT